MPRHVVRRRPVVATALLLALIGSVAPVAPPALTLAADPARSVELAVSWTRPGVPGTTFTPPAALRVGDEVTAKTVLTGFEVFGSAACFLTFSRGDGSQAPQVGAYVETYADATCHDWTFIVPPTAAGTHTLALFTTGAEGETFDEAIALTVEPGGTPREVISNVPLRTWDLTELVGAERVRFGEPWTIPAPTNAQDRCQYEITGSYLTSVLVYGQPGSCGDWTVTLPDIRPFALRSHALNGYPWQVSLHASWARDDGTWHSSGRMQTGELLVDDALDVATFSSSLPAAVFTADDNPYFAYAGTVTRTPQIVGITTGTCRWEVKLPGQTTEIVGDVTMVDGGCEPLDFEVDAVGAFQAFVYLIDDEGTWLAGASGGGEIIEPLPDPVIELPPEPVEGEPVEIDASTPSGTPLEYEIEPVLETATAGYAAAAASPVACSGASGTFLLGEGERSATATCTFPAPGTYRVTATFRDPIGTERQTSTTIEVAPDTVAPAISNLRQRLVPGSQLGTSAIPVQIAWTASDAGSGVDHVEVAHQTDGGPWVVIDGDLAAASITRDQYRGHRYRFRVRAVDGAGNVSPWSYTATFGPTAYSETNAKLRYTGTWSTAASSGAYGGALRATSRSGASASITFTGRSVAWIAPRSPIRGWARVYLDGVYKARVNLAAPSLEQRRLAFAWNWTTRGTHTLRIVNEATGGRPRIDLDAIVVLD